MFLRTSAAHHHDHSHDHGHSHHHHHHSNGDHHDHDLPTVPDDPHDYREEVSVRFHSVSAFLFHWSGSVTEQTWPKVLAYMLYLASICLLFTLNCDKNDVVHNSARCKFGREDVVEGIAGIFALWMAFTAFLFTSFVNAGLDRFRHCLNLVRSLQGRCNEMSLLLNAQINLPHGEHTLSVARRLLAALPYVMFSASPKLGNHGEEFLQQAHKILEDDEWQHLLENERGDRPYAILLWLDRLVQCACHDESADSIFCNPSNVSWHMTGAVERTRGTFGSLIDSLDDAILPFPFANLIISNIYIVFALLPFAMLSSLGYALIPAGAIYFWFLDGMVTFVFLVDECFSDKVLGKQIAQPLIDLHVVCAEAAKAVPRRFPGALSNAPASISNVTTK